MQNGDPTTRARAVVLQLNRVSKAYRNGGTSAQVLDRVSFQVFRRQLTTIVGASGSGKTTLLRVIGGLSAPDKGTVTIAPDGDLYGKKDSDLCEYRNKTVGYIFQDYRLLRNYNAIENVMLPLKVAGLTVREQNARAARALDVVGLRGYKQRRITQLSGGQEQRVGIARALAMRPKVLIADEPTGNLDSVRSAEIMGLFQRLRTQQGLTIVMVTHDYDLATQADHLIRIVDGRVREDSHASS